MSERRYDFEYPLAQAFADYLSLVDEAAMGACEVVTFFDPMSIDEANRVVVDVPSGQTDTASAANFDGELEVIVKSRWAQKTLADDFQTHRDRVNEVRDKLMSLSLADDVNEKAVGLAVDHVRNRRSFRSTTKTDLWFISEIRLEVSGHWVAS